MCGTSTPFGTCCSDDDAKEEDQRAARRASLKRSFLSKVFCPVLGYAGPQRLVGHWREEERLMKGTDWKVRHAAVLDLQRQCGMPELVTLAPYEWSAPYHQAILHDMEQLLAPRLRLAGMETFHLAHVLVETMREFVCGGAVKHGSTSKRWTKHVLRHRTDPSLSTVVNFALRLEFHHGRGSVHLHGLTFFDDLKHAGLEECLRATVADETTPIRNLALMSQSDRAGNSGWPVREEPSVWNEDAKRVELRHAQADQDVGWARSSRSSWEFSRVTRTCCIAIPGVR